MRKVLSLLLAFWCIIPTEALELRGGCSNTRGRIGITVSLYGKIYCVHRISPAFDAGIQVGDIVIEADGVQGTKQIDAGTAGSVVHIVILRKKEVLIFNIVRQDPRVIRD